MVTPLTVTIGWLRRWQEGLRAGLDDRAARQAASRAESIEGKAFAHCRIKTGTLTVPVEGGAGVLKRRGAEPVLSEHGKWRREHLGAWNAAYGRAPYYEHLMPEIEAVYAASEGMTLEEFNSRLLGIAERWLEPGRLTDADKERLEARRAETRAKAEEGLSIFDLLFRLGKEGVLAL